MNINEYDHLSSVWSHMSDKTVVKGIGSRLYTSSNTSLLDFTSGIGVNSTGHSHPKVAKAIAEQASNLIFSQINCICHNRVFELTEELRKVVPPELSRFFYAQSGAEAVEAAVKLAKHATKKSNIIVFKGSFHGRTHLTMAMTTSKTIYRKSYPNLPSGIFVTPFPYSFATGREEESEIDYAISELKLLLESQSAPEDTAAIFIEPVLGEGGYIPAPYKFLQKIRNICDKHNILMVVDEIQTGFGRTGKMFAFQWHDVIPDIITMAKGLGSGAPISAIAYRERFDKEWIKGTHGGTYSANPLGCAAAIATLKVIKEEKLVENSLNMGSLLLSELKKLQNRYGFIGDVRGRGLMIGIELMDGEMPDTKLPSKILKEVYDRGLMLLSCGIRKNVIRWIPPLTVTKEEIYEGLKIFTDSIEAILNKDSV